MPEIVVDSKAIEQLGADIGKGKKALIGRLGERGYQLLREEIKDSAYETGNLWQGVAPPDVDYEKLEAVLTVSARSAETGATEAKVIGADGEEKKTVSLRARPAYNYAEIVARGNRAATLTPKTAKAFLIPVPTAPSGESYLLAGGQIFIIRKSRKGQKPNPYDERAAKRLTAEAPKIAEAVLRQFI
jgi:hypothetical protein